MTSAKIVELLIENLGHHGLGHAVQNAVSDVKHSLRRDWESIVERLSEDKVKCCGDEEDAAMEAAHQAEMAAVHERARRERIADAYLAAYLAALAHDSHATMCAEQCSYGVQKILEGRDE